MKRRNWLWFGASGILAVGAGVLAILALRFFAIDGQATPTPPAQSVVVALNPIAAQQLIRVDNVKLAALPLDQVPADAYLEPNDVVHKRATRDIIAGEVIRFQDVMTPTSEIPADKVVVAVPADDILSGWGAVLPGDHVDVLFTLDLILETPMYPEETITLQEGETIQRLERDQSLDNVSVLTLQNLEVLRVIEEPISEPEAVQEQQPDEEPVVREKALLLLVDPQDAVVLKYMLDSEGKIDLALRAATNQTLFDVDSVNINYLLLRYGMALPEQPE